jgi:hypothetical protein
LVKLKREGDQAVVHGRRGRRSNRKLDEEEPGPGGSDPGAREISGVRPDAGQRIPGHAGCSLCASRHQQPVILVHHRKRAFVPFQ